MDEENEWKYEWMNANAGPYVEHVSLEYELISCIDRFRFPVLWPENEKKFPTLIQYFTRHTSDEIRIFSKKIFKLVKDILKNDKRKKNVFPGMKKI